MRDEIKYSVDEDFGGIFDEKGNIFLALRKIAWGDSSDYKIDIRKWYNTADGGETVGKGVTFLTEEGPNELTKVLLDNGFGYTNEVIESIKDRDDFMTSLVEVLNKSEDQIEEEMNNINEEYYDPSTMLLGDEEDE